LKEAKTMQKMLKILGKRGRVTIPWELRRALGFAYNDVVSFEQDGDAVLVKREKLCNKCAVASAPPPQDIAAALTELLDGLTAEELRTALIRFSVRWAERTQKGGETG
jgi:bifunctional DNA-binding transcriptional regulator/antitoxin component of YhaV-PrlF toxin-antitoxin module